MEATLLKRKFVIKSGGESVTIEDPNPSYSLEEVIDFLAGEYPEVTNGYFGKPTEKDGILTYEISTSYGTKG